MPFMADYIYKEIGGPKESVHLDDWPEIEKKLIDEKLEEQMQEARNICSLALQKRAGASLKVRQPLSKLQIPNYKLSNDLLGLIKDEVNVKEIVVDEKLKEGVVLDTEITVELKEEGIVRDFIRSIQAKRKGMGLTPKDKIRVIFGDEKLKEIVERNKEQIKRSVVANDIAFETGKGLTISADLL